MWIDIEVLDGTACMQVNNTTAAGQEASYANRKSYQIVFYSSCYTRFFSLFFHIFWISFSAGKGFPCAG